MRIRSGIFLVVCLAFLSSCGPTLDPQEERGLAVWGNTVQGKTVSLAQQSAVLGTQAKKEPVSVVRARWQAVADIYHPLEGMIGGVPRFRSPMLAIGLGLNPEGPDAGSKDVAVYSASLPDGRPLKVLGNLLHAMTEPMLWQRGVWSEKTDQDALVGATRALAEQTKLLRDAARSWKPSREDAFRAVESTLSYTGYRVFQWSEAKKGTAASEPNEVFPAQSRLVGMRLALEGGQWVYRTTFRHALTPEEISMLDQDFREIFELIKMIEAEDQKGKILSEEQRTVLIDKAASLGERAADHLDQSARRLGLSLTSGT